MDANDGNSNGLEEKIIIPPKRRNAMVSSGGGLKAHFFHIGVGMRLQEEGFKFQGGILQSQKTELKTKGELGNKDIDMYIGSSGGALFSIGVAMGHSPEEMYELFMDDEKLRKVGLERGTLRNISPNFQIVTELGKTIRRGWRNGFHTESMSPMSPISLSKLEDRLHYFLETEDFREVAADLFVVCTPLNHPHRIVYSRKSFEETDRLIYRNDADISSTVAASCSLQFFHPFCLNHHNGDQLDMVDGETRKTLSTHLASDNGADMVFVSYTHVPYKFTDIKGSIKKYGLVRVAIQSAYIVIEQKIKEAIRKIAQQKKACSRTDEVFDWLAENLPDQEEVLEVLEEGRGMMVNGLEEDLDFRRDVDYVFVHPDEDDADFFFEPHLSMKQDYIERIVKKGYEAADRALTKYEFSPS